MRKLEVKERHIFGMGKSSLSLEGGKGRNLELDVLRLIHVVSLYRQKGLVAHGYQQVMTTASQRRVLSWLQKYEGGDKVTVFSTYGSKDSVPQLVLQEKRRNAVGIAGGRKEDSIASTGEVDGESALESYICDKERGVQKVSGGKEKGPMGIRWDFYGVVKIS